MLGGAFISPELFGVALGDVVHAEVAGAKELYGAVPHVDLQTGEVAEVFEVVGGEGVTQDVGLPFIKAGGASQGSPAFFPAARDDGSAGGAVGGGAQKPGAQDLAHAYLSLGGCFGVLGFDEDGFVADADVSPADAGDFGGAQAGPKHQADGRGAADEFFFLGGAQQLANFDDGEGSDGFFWQDDIGEAVDGVDCSKAEFYGAAKDAVHDAARFAPHGHGREAFFDEAGAICTGDLAYGHVAPPRSGSEHAAHVLRDFLKGAFSPPGATEQGDFKEFPEGPVLCCQFALGTQQHGAAENAGALGCPRAALPG